MAGIKILAKNRKAYHEYQISVTMEAGIVLKGTEVKSVRSGKINLSDGWIDINDESEAFLRQVHISSYTYGNINNHDEARSRKLLLKKAEIKRLEVQQKSKGMTLVPLKVYAKGQLIKIELGLGKGKKLYDKRESSKEKDASREIERAMKNKNSQD